MSTVADDANALPEGYRARDAVAALRKEDHTLAGGLLHLIDGGLQRVRVVGDAVRVRAEAAGAAVDRVRIVWALRIDRLSPQRREGEGDEQRQKGAQTHAREDRLSRVRPATVPCFVTAGHALSLPGTRSRRVHQSPRRRTPR